MSDDSIDDFIIDDSLSDDYDASPKQVRLKSINQEALGFETFLQEEVASKAKLPPKFISHFSRQLFHVCL